MRHLPPGSGCSRFVPALFTRPSMRGKARMRAGKSSAATSATMVRIRSLGSASTRAMRSVSVRETAITSAPAEAQASAQALPMPRPAPVTRTVSPLNGSARLTPGASSALAAISEFDICASSFSSKFTSLGRERRCGKPQSRIATARVQPAEAPLIFTGKQQT